MFIYFNVLIIDVKCFLVYLIAHSNETKYKTRKNSIALILEWYTYLGFFVVTYTYSGLWLYKGQLKMNEHFFAFEL